MTRARVEFPGRRVSVVVVVVVAVLAGGLARPPVARAVDRAGFADVSTGHPFAPAIAWLVGSGITTGYADGTFRPTAPVTRQALAAFLYRYDQATVAGGGSPFTDVGAAHPFANEILWLADNGVAGGYPDGTFRPTEPITREALAAFLYRANGTPDLALEAIPPATPFTDVGVGHAFAREIAWLARTGITTGFPDGSFHPAAPVDRQSLAAFLHRMAGSPAAAAPGRNRVDRTVTRVVDVASVVGTDQGPDGTTVVSLTADASLPSPNQFVVIDAGGLTPDGLIGRVATVDAVQHRFVLAWAGIDEVYPSGKVDVVRVVEGAPAVALARQAESPSAPSAATLEGCPGVDLSVTPSFRVLIRVRASWGPGRQPSVLVDLQSRVDADGRLLSPGYQCDQTFDLPVDDLTVRAYVPGLPPLAAALDFGGAVEVSTGSYLGLAGQLLATHTLRFSLVDGTGTWTVLGGSLTNWQPTASGSPWLAGSATLSVGPRLELAWFGATGIDARLQAQTGAVVTPGPDPAIAMTTSRGRVVEGQAHPERWFLSEAPWALAATEAVDASTSYTRPKVLAPFGLPAPVTGTPYTGALLGAGGLPYPPDASDPERGPYDWAVQGDLPPGLTLDGAGRLTGTPAVDATNGEHRFLVTVTDRVSLSRTRAFVLTIDRPEITSTTLPFARLGNAYAKPLTATGGAAGDLTWSAIGGHLPPGLSLSATGRVEGHPTSLGTYVFTARATDALGQYDDATVEVLVKPADFLIGWKGTVTEDLQMVRTCWGEVGAGGCTEGTYHASITVHGDGTFEAELTASYLQEVYGMDHPGCYDRTKLTTTAVASGTDVPIIEVTSSASGTTVSVSVPIHVTDDWDDLSNCHSGKKGVETSEAMLVISAADVGPVDGDTFEPPAGTYDGYAAGYWRPSYDRPCPCGGSDFRPYGAFDTSIMAWTLERSS